jgi:hypothetical protein
MLPFSFSLRPPRHPLLRVICAVAGLLLLGFFAVFAVVVASVVLLGFGLRRLLTQQRGGPRPLDPQATRARDPDVIEGEFAVVRKSVDLLPR